MDERRQLPRWEINKEVKVWVPLTQGFSHCIVKDLHLKGMSVSFNKQLPQQESIRMSFALGDDYDFIKIEAQVPWMKQAEGRYVYGLSFSKIGDEDKERMYQYISTHCYDQFRKNWWA